MPDRLHCTRELLAMLSISQAKNKALRTELYALQIESYTLRTEFYDRQQAIKPSLYWL